MLQLGAPFSLDEIRDGFAQEYPADELVIATCLNAYEAILRRAGIRREVTDTDLFR